ncbi:NACHT domain-containing protein [Anabaena cylindrica FACHB-243]|uniref:NACHT domain-containing protein n=1 Tax=Anabaena TaxID=1163 RepID=UPI001683DF8C|nr:MULTISPECIES: NACHT domain-containing protein [Anabaena]MBD2420308.1 NACHT domain-containing protein [Anabaena cylindrica FACHB-243]MCM2406033.1 NACHT domain-containing protein [Anabaena sp. CCAP 1446/1C]
MGQGRNDDLKEITKEVINKFAEKGIPDDPSLFRRLSITVVDLEDDAQAKSAQVMLSQVLANKNQASQAWKILGGDGLTLITNRGRRDAEGIARLLGSVSIQLSANSSNPAITAELYREWLEKTTSDFIVLGIEKKLSIETDWIPLKAKQSNGDQAIFKAELIPELYHLTVVVGDPGSGKSTLVKRLAYQLCVLDKKVLRVRLKQINNLCKQQHQRFEDAIFKAAADSSGVNEDQLKFALSCPDYLLVDGFDECDDLANMASQLTAWASGHSVTRIIMTTRPGYALEYFSDWKQIEILPLEASDIIKFAKRIFEIYSIDKENIKEQEILFENWLKNTQTASLAARNPLLLGFVVQLFPSDANSILNRANIYENIVHLLCQQDTQDRESIKIDKEDEPIAQRIIEIAGWKLMYQPEFLESEFYKILTNDLLSEFKNLTRLKVQTQVKKYISFWEQRRIFEKNKVGLNHTINFIHLTICEYAAAKYVSDLDDQKICKWLEEVRQDIKWQEVILFAAGLDKVEIIVNHLVKLDNLENTNSTDILLAAKALTEVNNAPFELRKAVFKRLQIRLESPNASIVIDAAKVLLSLIPQAPDLIGNIAQSLSYHTQSWTRLAAIRLGLECGDNYVNLNILRAVINECITKSARIYYQSKLPYIVPPSDQQKKDYGKYGRGFQEEVLVQGFQLLLKKQPNLETFKYIQSVINNEDCSLDTTNKLDEIFTTYVLEEWKNEKDTEYKKEYESLLMKLVRVDKPITLQQSLLQHLKKLKQKERTKYADRSFLEAVLRVTDSNLKIFISVQQVQELIALGVLVKGMSWWKFLVSDWYFLNENNDLEAVDAVIKGAIAALNIEHEKIAIEAKIALEQIQFCDELDVIKSVLKGETIKSENSSQTFDWALEKIREISSQNYSSLSLKIPTVPAEPKWERAREINISPENLVRALKHPSQGIYQNATLLLMNGVGGSEAINLIKELLKENKDNEQVLWAVSNIAPHLLEDEALETEN